VKKIKKFKINLRFRDICRNLKNIEKHEITDEIEQAVEKEMSRLKDIVSPASVYETISKEKINFDFKMEVPEKWIAVSLYVATIGSSADDVVKNTSNESDSKIINSVFIDGLDQSVNFIYRLIDDEAKSESCDIALKRPVKDNEVLSEIFKILPIDKIGVSYFGSGNYNPAYTTCGVIFWAPQKKRGKK
jgi:hypothetical protein